MPFRAPPPQDGVSASSTIRANSCERGWALRQRRISLWLRTTPLLSFNDYKPVSVGGLEPPTLCLKGRCSTPELHARTFTPRPDLIGTGLFHSTITIYETERQNSMRIF